MTRRPLGPRPDPLPRSNRLLSFCFQAPAVFASTAFFGSLSLAASLFEKDGKRQHRIAQAWARTLVAISGCPVTILGQETLRKHPVAVYACNHLSYMDTPAVFASMPFQFRIVARHDLWKMPFIGWHLRRSGQVPVNVDNPRASISSLGGAVRTLKSGMPLFIFPEGGRTESGHPNAFLNGPAFMAIRAQVPIVPMALIGTHELLPIHTGAVLSRAHNPCSRRTDRNDRLFHTADRRADCSPERRDLPLVLCPLLFAGAGTSHARSHYRNSRERRMTDQLPRIAIPEPTSTEPDYNQRSWPQYAQAVEACGAVAVPVPLSESPRMSPNWSPRVAEYCCLAALPM